MKALKLTRVAFLILPLFFCINLSLSFSQESAACAENLKTAQLSFSKGQVDLIPDLLAGCLKSGFTKEESLAAYKLLIQTLIFNNKLAEADSSMLAFLKSNPEYKLSQTDHSSFVFLYNSFNVRPVLLLSIRTGLNVPFLTFIRNHPTSGLPGTNKFQTDASNLFLSVEGKMKLNDKLEIGSGIGYSQIKFTNQISYYDYSTIRYTESQLRLEIPVFVSYDIVEFGKFTLFGRGGLGAVINLANSADIALNTTDKNNPYSRTGGTLNVKDTRPLLDLAGQLGSGIKFKVPMGFLFIEARANFGIFDQNRGRGSSTNLQQFWYLYSSPDYRLNTFNLNLGYTYIFYKPSKKKA